MSKKSLGLIAVPERTVEHDLTLLERFQEFSAELLRIALIGISAIGLAVSKIVLPGTETTPLVVNPTVRFLIVSALIALAISVAAALVHRYFAADSMSWHLQAMRRYERNAEHDVETADSESKARFLRFKITVWAIACSAITLGTGAILFVAAIVLAIP